MSSVREKIRGYVLREFIVDQGSLTFADDTNLEECGIIDSFSLLDLVSFVEKEFDVQVEPEDLESGRLLSLAGIEGLILERGRSLR